METKKHGALKFGEFGRFQAEFDAVKHINGSSLTIPGQARDLAALLASSKFSGGMIPRHGTPQFDSSPEAALARVQFEAMDEEQVSEIALRGAASVGAKKELRDDAKPNDEAPTE